MGIISRFFRKRKQPSAVVGTATQKSNNEDGLRVSIYSDIQLSEQQISEFCKILPKGIEEKKEFHNIAARISAVTGISSMVSIIEVEDMITILIKALVLKL